MTSTLPMVAARIARLSNRSAVLVLASATSRSSHSFPPASHVAPLALLHQQQQHRPLSSGLPYSAPRRSTPLQNRTEHATRGRRGNSNQAGPPPPPGQDGRAKSSDSSQKGQEEPPRKRTSAAFLWAGMLHMLKLSHSLSHTQAPSATRGAPHRSNGIRSRSFSAPASWSGSKLAGCTSTSRSSVAKEPMAKLSMGVQRVCA